MRQWVRAPTVVLPSFRAAVPGLPPGARSRRRAGGCRPAGSALFSRPRLRRRTYLTSTNKPFIGGGKQ